MCTLSICHFAKLTVASWFSCAGIRQREIPVLYGFAKKKFACMRSISLCSVLIVELNIFSVFLNVSRKLAAPVLSQFQKTQLLQISVSQNIFVQDLLLLLYNF